MAKQDYYYVRVDKYGKWSPCEYRKVSCEELDELLDKFGRIVLAICGYGSRGAMAMLACFHNRICGGCYSDLINAYRLLTDDSKSLVDREHELRHAWEEYEELWRIRYYGTVEGYYRARAEEAKAERGRYIKNTSEE